MINTSYKPINSNLSANKSLTSHFNNDNKISNSFYLKSDCVSFKQKGHSIDKLPGEEIFIPALIVSQVNVDLSNLLKNRANKVKSKSDKEKLLELADIMYKDAKPPGSEKNITIGEFAQDMAAKAVFNCRLLATKDLSKNHYDYKTYSKYLDVLKRSITEDDQKLIRGYKKDGKTVEGYVTKANRCVDNLEKFLGPRIQYDEFGIPVLRNKPNSKIQDSKPKNPLDAVASLIKNIMIVDEPQPEDTSKVDSTLQKHLTGKKTAKK